MFYFGQTSRPEMTPERLLPGTIIGSSFLIFTIVNFDLERLNGRRLGFGFLAALASLLGGALTAGIIFGPLYFFGIVDRVGDYLRQDQENYFVMFSGGAFYGLPVGAVLGIVIGCAAILTERWSGKPFV